MQVPSKKFLHGGRLNFPDWLLPLAFLFLDTLQPHVLKIVAQSGVAFWCRFRTIVTLMPETSLVNPSNTALLLSTGNKYLSTPLNPIRFLITAAVSIFPCLASKVS